MPAPAPSDDRIVLAVVLRLISAACMATMNAFIKLAEGGGAHLSEILFARQVIGIPLVGAVIAFGPGLGNIRTQRFGAHLTRAIVGLTSMTCLFTGIMLLPLAESTTLAFAVPIFATILGALVLKEPTGWHRWGAVLAGFVGVMIVAQPGSGDLPFWGVVAGIAAAFLTAVVMILLRRIGRTEHPFTTVFWFATLSTVPLSIAVALDHGHVAGWTWLWLLGVGVCGNCGQLAMTGSLKHGPVSLVVPIDYSGLIWATLYGWLLFSALPTAATWLGAPLIIASGLYIVHRERIRHREQTRRALAEE
ncbi:MAG: DMT family transporter [Sphingomonas sp.]